MILKYVAINPNNLGLNYENIMIIVFEKINDFNLPNYVIHTQGFLASALQR